MKLDELKELKIDGIRSVSLDKRFCFNECSKNYDEPKIFDVIGRFEVNGYKILEYNEYEMKFYKDYEIRQIDIPIFGKSYFNLKPVKPHIITYLSYTKKQMIDLLNNLKNNRLYYEKQKMVKEKLINLENDFK